MLGTPAKTPMALKRADSALVRQPPFAGWSASTCGAQRRIHCTMAIWILPQRYDQALEGVTGRAATRGDSGRSGGIHSAIGRPGEAALAARHDRIRGHKQHAVVLDDPGRGLNPSRAKAEQLVALHSDFDELIIGRNQLWKIGRIDAESDGACGAWLSCDEAGLFER
jgi:hypothetical protein